MSIPPQLHPEENGISEYYEPYCNAVRDDIVAIMDNIELNRSIAETGRRRRGIIGENDALVVPYQPVILGTFLDLTSTERMSEFGREVNYLINEIVSLQNSHPNVVVCDPVILATSSLTKQTINIRNLSEPTRLPQIYTPPESLPQRIDAVAALLKFMTDTIHIASRVIDLSSYGQSENAGAASGQSDALTLDDLISE
jgi:hypothetical protein